MADYAISNVPRRVVYANTGVGPYAFTFEILDQTDIAVYRGSTLLTITTDYSVTINTNGTGSVTLVTAGTGNITIVGAKNIQRTTDFTTGGDLFANSLNDELDNLTIFVQQVAETAERGMKAPVVDPTDINMTLPSKTDRAGTFLAFDSPSGNPIAGPSIASVGTVTQNIANINTVAADIANVNTVATNITNVNTVAGISGNVTTVAGISANVTSVAGNSSNINTVAGSISNVNATGSNIASVNTVAGELGVGQDVTVVAADLTGADNIGIVAGSITDINALGPIAADIATVAGIETDVTTVAGIDSDVTTVSGIAANVTTVAGISANVTSVAGNATNINTVATNITNVNAVGSNIANVNSVAGNATNINAVVSNATNINTVAGISSNVTTVATNNANVTTVATNITNVNTNATNIANINQNAANIVAIQNASANATAAANSATAAASSATSASASAAAASAVALGNEPVRHSVRPSLLLDFANSKTLDPRITFTRGSTATFYDGKTVAKAEENLFLNSQSFQSTSYWNQGRANCTVVDNADTAPDGTTTAASFIATAQNGGLGASSTQPPVGTYTMSIWVKASSSSVNQLKMVMSNGTVIGSFTPTTSWARYSFTFTTTTTVWFYAIQDQNASGFISYSIWGAQLEQRSSVTAYTATTTAPITNYIPALQTAASGVARFEHNPVTGESLGLEIEEQRTNLLLQSADFSTTWSNTTSATQTNVVVAPDGTLSGDKLLEDTTNNVHVVAQAVSVTSGTTYTVSCFMKKAERGFGLIALITGFPTTSIQINLTTGAVSTGTGTPLNAFSQDVGNGWFRVGFSLAANSTTSAAVNLYTSNDGVWANRAYLGNGFSGIYIWGAQLEAGAFATSYIPTVASQITRSADSASMTGTNFSSWYRADEGTLYAEHQQTRSLVTQQVSLYVGIDFNNRYQLGQSTSFPNGYGFIASNGSTTALMVGTSAITSGNSYKQAMSYKANDFAYSINASTPSTDSSGAVVVGASMLYIGMVNNGSENLNLPVKKIAYYPKRLTNAELQGLTTV